MVWKILIFLAASLGGWLVMKRLGAAGGGKTTAVAPRQGTVSEELVVCAECGAYRPAKGLCLCQKAPSP